MTNVTQMPATKPPRPTLSQQLLALADDERLPADVRERLRHASHRAKRKDDELEVARVTLHNLDMEDCPRCGAWYGIEALDAHHWCRECISAASQEAYEDRREDAREARRQERAEEERREMAREVWG